MLAYLKRWEKHAKTVEQMLNPHTQILPLQKIYWIVWLVSVISAGMNGNYSLRPKYYKWLLKEYPSNLVGKLRFQLIEWNWMGKPGRICTNRKAIELSFNYDG